MIFNCHFCQKEMKPLGYRSSSGQVQPYCECQCPYHSAEVHYSYDLQGDSYRLRWISITKELDEKSYEIFLMQIPDGGIPINTLELGLWGEFDKTNPKNIYQVLYQGPILEDLTPENCADFIKRILALKAFL